MSRSQLAEVVAQAITVLNPARTPIKGSAIVAAPITTTLRRDQKRSSDQQP